MHCVSCTEHLSRTLETLLDCRGAHATLISDFIVCQTCGQVTQGLQFNFGQARMLSDCTDDFVKDSVCAVPVPLGFCLRAATVSSADVFMSAQNELTGDSRMSSL